ncbi:MAG: NAD(P)-dependent oxidoreductase [Thermomicrobiales bacterium]
MATSFRIGLTRDFLNADGSIGLGDIGLGLLDAHPGVTHEFLAENTRELTAEQIAGYDALAVLAPRITAATLTGADRLAVIARYGVGYDTVDLAACTEHGVAVTITPDGVRRAVASAVVTLVLALSHRMFDQDRATRAGTGWRDKLSLMGYGLQGKTIGFVGLGNIGGEVVRLLAPFGVRPIAHDPYLEPAKAEALGVPLVDLDALLAAADFVVILCALNAETRHLIDAERLGRMKPTAFLINTARGPIVDQKALYDALSSRRIRGAGLDVFEEEPIDPNEPLLQLDNVIVTPHALCWTDEWATITGQSAMQSMLAIAAGNVPTYVVNKDVVDTPRFQEKLARFRSGRDGQ